MMEFDIYCEVYGAYQVLWRVYDSNDLDIVNIDTLRQFLDFEGVHTSGIQIVATADTILCMVEAGCTPKEAFGDGSRRHSCQVQG